MINIGKPALDYNSIKEVVDELSILNYYFNITSIPCVIKCPYRIDNNPSLGFYTRDGETIMWTDFSTREKGNILSLLSRYWKTNLKDTYNRLIKDLPNIKQHEFKTGIKSTSKIYVTTSSDIDLRCKVRDWKKYDIEYWESFGINLKWLKYADIYPISHKIIIKNNKKYVFKADKYAYAYVEFKDNKVTLKIYQPYNTKGFKWANRHDRSVISLWTKIPKTGDKVCICASMKDALCLWANTGIPSIALQGEGYGMSDTAINELKSRFKQVYICLDNDKAGIEDAKSLASKTGFINVVLPKINEAKDISDLYLSLQNKQQFKNILLDLFN